MPANLNVCEQNNDLVTAREISVYAQWQELLSSFLMQNQLRGISTVTSTISVNKTEHNFGSENKYLVMVSWQDILRLAPPQTACIVPPFDA